jgi:hypothetical protein
MDAEEPNCATLPCQFFHHALCQPPQTSEHKKTKTTKKLTWEVTITKQQK